MKYKVTMVCREVHRAEVTIVHDNNDQEVIKDKAWELFDAFCKDGLEQENDTKIEVI